MAAKLIKPSPPIFSGPGAIQSLGAEAKKFGASKVFTCTDAGLTKAGVTGRITEVLKKKGLEVVVFDAVEANPSTVIVEAGANALRSSGANIVITLGGGSSMDAGKAMTCLAAQPAGTRMVDLCISPSLKEGTGLMDPMSFVPKKV